MSFFHDGPTLEVDLDAVVRNWRLLGKQFTGSSCAAVVKANAYGLGADEVTRALYAAGCRHFFVATLDEAIALKPDIKDAKLYVFHGIGTDEEREFTAHGLIPVLNDRSQVQRWADLASGLPAVLHIDTGMCRLGISLKEAKAIAADATLLKKLNLSMVMSHLACAGEPQHPKNAEQLAIMRQAQELFPLLPVSFANSSGIFLPRDFHFNLARPGCSLYGITPNTHLANPVENVVHLSAPIVQLREITQDTPVGYGCSYTAKAGARIATLAIGYADGYFRHLGNKAHGMINGVKVPVVGRVSMDMITVEVSTAHAQKLTPGSRITLIGESIPVDTVAGWADTIGYEVFTRLGRRIRRLYKGS